MSFWDTFRRWFRSEAESAKDLAGDLEADWSGALDRKEAELGATPSERIEQLQDRIADNDSTLDEIKARVEAAGIDLDRDEDPDNRE